MKNIFTKFISTTIISVIFSSCFHSAKKENEVITFNSNSFTSATVLTAEEINFNKPLHPMLFDIINDSLIMCNNWTGKPYYMELYNMNTNALITKFAKRGKGPNEWLSVYISYKTRSNNSFILHDIHTKTASVFSIDSVLKYGEKYYPKRVDIPSFTGNNIEKLDSSTLLIFNKYHVSDERYNNDTKSLFSFDINKKNDFQSIRNSYKYFTHNVTGGYIAVSPVHDRVWVFYQNENRIDIYNKSIKLVKTMLGPDIIKPEYKCNSNNALFLKKSINTYGSCFYTKTAVYVIYQGEYDDLKAQRHSILKFSWDGDLLHRYKIPQNINLETIYVDSKEEYIIGTDYIPNEYPKLYKFKIN